MRRAIIAGNWKMHLTIEEAVRFVTQLKGTVSGMEGIEVVVCPPFTALSTVAKGLAGSSIRLGAQDVFWELQGAFTGEVSPAMLRDAGCQYVIIGHSERRTQFGETDAIVHRKLLAALQAGLRPIVCVGETLAEREADQTFSVLTRQLAGALEGLSRSHWEQLVLAYEPVWAIGTGRNATPDQAQEAQAFMRKWLATHAGQGMSDSLRIQYGGSVNATIAASLLQQPDVDGALVGGASLHAATFAAIVKAAQEAKMVVG